MYLAAAAQQLVVDGDGGDPLGLAALGRLGHAQHGDQVGRALVAVELEAAVVHHLGVVLLGAHCRPRCNESVHWHCCPDNRCGNRHAMKVFR